MHSKPGQKEPSILVKFVSAGLAASVAEAVTIPIDTAKVRLQVSGFIIKSSCSAIKTMCARKFTPLDRVVCNLQLSRTINNLIR